MGGGDHINVEWASKEYGVCTFVCTCVWVSVRESISIHIFVIFRELELLHFNVSSARIFFEENWVVVASQTFVLVYKWMNTPGTGHGYATPRHLVTVVIKYPWPKLLQPWLTSRRNYGFQIFNTSYGYERSTTVSNSYGAAADNNGYLKNHGFGKSATVTRALVRDMMTLTTDTRRQQRISWPVPGVCFHIYSYYNYLFNFIPSSFEMIF